MGVDERVDERGGEGGLGLEGVRGGVRGGLVGERV